jgi:hypothetical protein
VVVGLAMTAIESEYDAFISYRRTDGVKLARWLRRRLLYFKLPTDLLPKIEPWARELHIRRPRIFLDSAYEKPNPNFLLEKVYPALDRSKRLIVISTPAAFLPRRDRDGKTQENWLCLEIDHYIGDHKLGAGVRPIDIVLGPDAPEDRFPGRLNDNAQWDWTDFRAFRSWRKLGLMQECRELGRRWRRVPRLSNNTFRIETVTSTDDGTVREVHWEFTGLRTLRFRNYDDTQKSSV